MLPENKNNYGRYGVKSNTFLPHNKKQTTEPSVKSPPQANCDRVTRFETKNTFLGSEKPTRY